MGSPVLLGTSALKMVLISHAKSSSSDVALLSPGLATRSSFVSSRGFSSPKSDIGVDTGADIGPDAGADAGADTEARTAFELSSLTVSLVALLGASAVGSAVSFMVS